MPNVTNTLTAVITTQEDTTGSVPINRGTGNPALDVTVGEFVTYKLLATGSTDLQLPISPICQVYIKNLDTANTVNVTWTVNGGTAQAAARLNPSDQLVLWCDPTKPNPGVTDIALGVSASSCLVEYFLGG